MRLKYERHKVIMKWTRFFIIVYSVSVFFLFAKYSNFSVVWYIPDFNIKHWFVVFLIIDFLFNFFLVWPSLFVAVSDFPLFWNIWKMVLWVSPILFYLLRFFVVDYIWSDRIVRKIFRWKDIDVWNCPACHEYILKKPIVCCSNCWMKKFSEWKLFNNKYCMHCWFKSAVGDFDFPKHCPHCWLRFK